MIHEFSEGSHHMFLPAVGHRQGDGMINLKINKKKNKRQVRLKMAPNKFRILLRRHYGNARLPVEILQRIQAEEGRTPSKGRSVLERNAKLPMRRLSFVLQMLFSSVTNENIFYVFSVLIFLFPIGV